jgi:hypothetical protein
MDPSQSEIAGDNPCSRQLSGNTQVSVSQVLTSRKLVSVLDTIRNSQHRAIGWMVIRRYDSYSLRCNLQPRSEGRRFAGYRYLYSN